MTAGRTFLEAMFQDALPGTHTIICGFPGDPYKVDRSAWAGRPWSPGNPVPSNFDQWNSYLTVSSFEPDPETGELRRRKANFSAMHAVMVDDVGTKVASDRLRLPASTLIETSPGNYQAYFFLAQNEQARDRELCERLVDRMVRAGLTADGRDPGMKGVTRFGRLPMGINSKSKYVEQLGAPFQVRCVQFDPHLRYRLGEIAIAWKLDLTPTVMKSRAAVIPIDAANSCRSFGALIETLAIMKMYRGRIGSGPWHAIRCPWVDEHTGGSESGTAIADPSENNNFAGGFRCHHGHCDERTMSDMWRWVRKLSRILEREQA